MRFYSDGFHNRKSKGSNCIFISQYIEKNQQIYKRHIKITYLFTYYSSSDQQKDAF